MVDERPSLFSRSLNSISHPLGNRNVVAYPVFVVTGLIQDMLVGIDIPYPLHTYISNIYESIFRN